MEFTEKDKAHMARIASATEDLINIANERCGGPGLTQDEALAEAIISLVTAGAKIQVDMAAKKGVSALQMSRLAFLRVASSMYDGVMTDTINASLRGKS